MEKFSADYFPASEYEKYKTIMTESDPFMFLLNTYVIEQKRLAQEKEIEEYKISCAQATLKKTTPVKQPAAPQEVKKTKVKKAATSRAGKPQKPKAKQPASRIKSAATFIPRKMKALVKKILRR